MIVDNHFALSLSFYCLSAPYCLLKYKCMSLLLSRIIGAIALLLSVICTADSRKLLSPYLTVSYCNKLQLCACNCAHLNCIADIGHCEAAL